MTIQSQTIRSQGRKHKQPQGAALIAIAHALLATELGRLRAAHVCALGQFGRTQLNKLVRGGKLPLPHKEAANTAYWTPAQVRAFLESREAA